MTLELDDEELTDVREALRLHLMGLLRDLSRTDHRRFISQLRARYHRIEQLYGRLDHAAVTGPFAAPH
jgi:hypothetical protein